MYKWILKFNNNYDTIKSNSIRELQRLQQELGGFIVKTDYAYCLNKDTCLHRGGRKRWLGNYTDEAVKELYIKNRFIDEIDSAYCLDDIPYKYDSLDRFRLSDGSKMIKQTKD